MSDTPNVPPGAPTPSEPAGSTDATQRVDRVADDAERTIEQAEHRAEDRIADAKEAATARVRRTEEQVKEKVRETEVKVREQVAAVERTVGGFKELSEPTPAGSVDEAVRQAADLRRAIDRDIDALQAKLPPNEVLAEKAKTYGGAALAVVGAAAAAALAFKQRSARKKLDREARAHAAAIARYLPQAADEPRSATKEGGHGGLILLTVLAAAVGAFVVKQRRDQAEEPDLWGPA